MALYLSQAPERHFYAETAKRFPNTDALSLETGVLFRKFAADLEREIDHYLETHGLLSGRFSVLMNLMHAKEKGLKATSLAARLGVTRGNMTGLLDGLEDAGLISRAHDKIDRRASCVKLTKKGRALLDQVAKNYLKNFCVMLGTLTKKEKKLLIGMLNKMKEKMNFST